MAVQLRFGTQQLPAAGVFPSGLLTRGQRHVPLRIRGNSMMSRMDLSKAQKALLAWSAGFLLLAEGVKRIRIEGRAATIVGLIELLLAIATGVAFGWATTANSE